MRSLLIVAMFGVCGCGDDDGELASSSSSSSGPIETSSGAIAGSTSEAGSTGVVSTTTDAEGSSTSSASKGSTSSTGSEDDSGGSSEGSSEGSSGGAAVVGFAEIQVDLENMGGAQGQYPSCIDGAPCHNNPARNVVLVANPTPEQLMQNYQNIIDAPGVPWVTTLDDTAQMLNEVPIPDDVRARWLAWIEAGAPY